MRLLGVLVAVVLVAAACSSDASTSDSPDTTAADAAGASGTSATIGDQTLAGIDLSQHDVPLGDIVFDTFDGGSAPLDEVSADLVVSLLDAIPPLDDPPYVLPQEDPWLEPDELILGVVASDGTAYAHPHRILNFHEIVNVTFDGEPLLISYCPLCGSGVVYDRRVDGQELTFGNSSALYENDLVMVDRQTTTYWWQVAGRGIVGTLTGVTLDPVASTTTTWDKWLAGHPESLVLSRDLGFGNSYARDPFVGYAERVDDGNTPFPV